MRVNGNHVAMFLGVLALSGAPAAAQAYLGPGLGLGAIGAALGTVGAILLGVISVIWYPFKRMLRRLRAKKSAAPKPVAGANDEPAPERELD
jgi:Na+-driven multidrug efflux pump